MDRALPVKNAVSTVRTLKTFGVPVVHSTINVALTACSRPAASRLVGLLVVLGVCPAGWIPRL